jgi:hypothetical protein
MEQELSNMEKMLLLRRREEAKREAMSRVGNKIESSLVSRAIQWRLGAMGLGHI